MSNNSSTLLESTAMERAMGQHEADHDPMSSTNSAPVVLRRTTLAGLGAGGIGMAPAASTHHASAQDATKGAMAGHPIIGTWVVDWDVTTVDEAPSVVVYTADGGLLDPSQGVAGVWQATGPRSAAWTLVPLIDGGAGGYLAIRSTGEVAEEGNTLDSPYSSTVVTPDGTVVASGQGMSHYTRLQVEPIEEGGKPLAGFPTWELGSPPDATPAP
jgi:hypothetical protein